MAWYINLHGRTWVMLSSIHRLQVSPGTLTYMVERGSCCPSSIISRFLQVSPGFSRYINIHGRAWFMLSSLHRLQVPPGSSQVPPGFSRYINIQGTTWFMLSSLHRLQVPPGASCLCRGRVFTGGHRGVPERLLRTRPSD